MCEEELRVALSESQKVIEYLTDMVEILSSRIEELEDERGGRTAVGFEVQRGGVFLDIFRKALIILTCDERAT